MSTPKEPNFFSIDDVYEKGVDWYASLFADAQPEQICGEASPSYSRYPRFSRTRLVGSPSCCPDVKIVYIMRHPVDRFYSNYVFDRSYGHSDSIRETLARSHICPGNQQLHAADREVSRAFPARADAVPAARRLERSTPTEYCRSCAISSAFPASASRKRDQQLQANPRGRNYMAYQCNTSLQRVREHSRRTV